MALFDLHQRRINYLRISVIDRCNLRCLYCMPRNGISTLPREEILRFEEILKVAAFAVREGITKIRITGGEPLLRRGVVKLIGALGRIPGLADVSLTTNGTFLKEFARPLYAAGVRRINVSLDTLQATRYADVTGGGTLDALWKGIAAAEDAGFSPIKINMVVLRGINDDEIPAFVRLAETRGLEVRFIEFMAGGAGPLRRTHYLPTEAILKEVSRHADLIPVSPEPYAGPAVRYRLAGGVGTLGFISPVSRHFCDVCNRLRLTADGRLRACLFSDREIQLKPALRSPDGGGDAALAALFRTALDSKPAGHGGRPGTPPCLSRPMSGIGG